MTVTIKTPEQIADTIAWRRWRDVNKLQDAVFDAMVRAIEADRAQRAASLDALHAWAVDVSDSMSTDKCNDWSEELTRLVEIEREHKLVDEGPEPTSAEERDYGKYLDQQFWGDRD